jgi:micrococcal nuclease
MEVRSGLFPWLLALALSLLPANATAWSGKVVGVSDGDNITVLSHDGEEKEIRLYGIECPEKGQGFGRKAKEITSALILGKIVEVEPVTQDRFGKTVALVYFGKRKMNLSEELVRDGFAWVFIWDCNRPECEEWRRLEQEARERKWGLWAQPSPVPPWESRTLGRS